jgi:hypothetical protein
MKNNLQQLYAIGMTDDDARALRRISFTLRRWHEMECGTSGDGWARHIERDNDDAPYLITHYYRRDGQPYRTKIADRKRGALKRMAALMARYPGLTPYVQGDPRGCAVYVLRPGDVPEGKDADAHYSRGIPVY